MPQPIFSTELVSKMESFICVLFLTVLAGSYAFAVDNETDNDRNTKITNPLNAPSYQPVDIDDNPSDNQPNKNKRLVRVRRRAKKLQEKCEKGLALTSTGIGGAAGAGIGALGGGAVGSFVPVIGTGIGALLGNVKFRFFCYVTIEVRI